MTDQKHRALTEDERAIVETLHGTVVFFQLAMAKKATDYLELVTRIAQVEQAYPSLDGTPIGAALDAIRDTAWDGIREIGEAITR